MVESEKGVTTVQLGAIIIMIITMIGVTAVMYTRNPEIIEKIIELLSTPFWRGGDDNGDTEWYCSKNCDEAIDLGSFSIDGKRVDSSQVCSHSNLEIGELYYFRFKVEDSGEVSVILTPEIYEDEMALEYYCTTPTLEVLRDTCGGSVVEDDFPIEECPTASLKFYSEADKTYYVRGGVSEKQGEPPALTESSGRLTISLTNCETCVSGGVSEWCDMGTTGRCVDSCDTSLIGNCFGGVCVREVEHCTEATCEEELEFSDEETISDDSDLLEGESNLVVYGTKLYVFYHKQVTGFDKTTIWYKSTSDGVNWDGPNEVPCDSGYCSAPSAAVFNGMIYLAYQSMQGNWEIYVRYFDGAWYPKTRLTDNAWEADENPYLVVNEGALYAFWKSPTSVVGDGDWRIFYKKTLDGFGWSANRERVTNKYSGYPSADSSMSDKLALGYSGIRNEKWEILVREYDSFSTNPDDYEEWQVTSNRVVDGGSDMIYLDDRLFAFYHTASTSNPDEKHIYYNTRSPRSRCQMPSESGYTEVNPSVAEFKGHLFASYSKYDPTENNWGIYYRHAPLS